MYSTATFTQEEVKGDNALMRGSEHCDRTQQLRPVHPNRNRNIMQITRKFFNFPSNRP